MTDQTNHRENAPVGLTPATFHAQPGVADWRVTSWGPQACFRSSSLDAAAQLLPVVLSAAAEYAVEPDVDLRAEAIVIRIPYRGTERIPAGGARFAGAVAAEAGRLGLDPAPDLIQTVDIMVAQSGVDTRPFWAAALGYELAGETDAVDPLRRGPSLSFMEIPSAGRGRTHIDIFVPADHLDARRDAALTAGGRLADDSHAPMWWTLASPDNHGVDLAGWTDTWDELNPTA